jgi:flagellin-specific chaperone FliS
LEYYYKAKEYLREGDWAGYGRELDKLENILKQLSNTSADNN